MDIFGTLRFWVVNLQPSEFEKLMEERAGKGTLNDSIRTVVLASLLPAALVAAVFIAMGIFFGAVFGMLFAMIGSAGGNGAGLFGVGFGLLYIVIGVVAGLASIVFAPVSFLIGQAVYWVLARAFGGKGRFAEQSYFSSFIYAGYATVSILAFVPCVGSLVVFAALLLVLYLNFLMLKRVHSLDGTRAALVIAVPILAVIALYVVMAALMFLPPSAG
jgi:hypothetical protein